MNEASRHLGPCEDPGQLFDVPLLAGYPTFQNVHVAKHGVEAFLQIQVRERRAFETGHAFSCERHRGGRLSLFDTPIS